MKASEIAEAIEKIAPKEIGKSGDYLGFLYGDKDKDVKKLGVTWMATTQVIEDAVNKGIDMLVVHEAPFFKHYSDAGWYRDYPYEEKLANIARMNWLDKGNICIYRAHSNWDACPVLGVVDSYAESLGLKNMIAANRFNKVYEIEETTVEKFAKKVKKAMGIPIIVYGDTSAKIKKVGPMIGGFGGNLTNMVEEMVRSGAELIIAGDLIENTALLALELGVPIIQTLHSETERPGIVKQYEYLRKEFPKLEVIFFESGAARYAKAKITML